MGGERYSVDCRPSRLPQGDPHPNTQDYYSTDTIPGSLGVDNLASL